MNIYRGILCKDIASAGSFNYWSFCIFILLFIGVFTAYGTLNMFFLWLFFCLFLEQELSVLWNDETQNWNKYSPALMLPREAVVNVKYFQLLVNTAVGALIIELCAVIGCLVRGEQCFSIANLVVLSEIMSVMCIVSVCLFFIILGHKFLSFFTIVILAGAMGGLVGSGEIRHGDFCGNFILGLKNFPAFVADQRFHYIMIIVSLLVTCFMWRLAAVLYKKKDL